MEQSKGGNEWQTFLKWGRYQVMEQSKGGNEWQTFLK